MGPEIGGLVQGRGLVLGDLDPGIDLGLPSDVTLKGDADQKGLLQPRKDTVFALCPFPGVARHTQGDWQV